MSRYGSVEETASVADLVAFPVVTVRRSTAVGGLLVLLGLSVWAGFTGWYVLRKDDLASRLITRETVRQYAYEDRIAALRSEIDRLSSRALLDQDSVEARVSELTTRQSQLESRHAVVAMLADNLQSLGEASASSRQAPQRGAPATNRSSERPGTAKDILGQDTSSAGIPGLTSFAPIGAAKPMPAPEPLPLRGVDRKQVSWQTPEEPETREQKIGGAIVSLTTSIEQAQVQQVKAVSDFEASLTRITLRYRAVIADAHLDPDRLTTPTAAQPAQGGPFIPVSIDPKAGAFEAAVFRIQPKISQFARLKKAVHALPLRRPMPAGDGDMTSNFGYRIDPFTRSPAMHSGIDFKAEHGSTVRSAGAGRVVTADYSGGYGNMVEIDHGNDIFTRYGHMSVILVSEGQVIQPGTVIGRVGSTGRSTGPHLHYETRIGSEAVDPARFIRAGQKFTP
jgi:murein DD-endopeptidase MepM/ murein hydrolase activator NlpD